MDGWEGPDAAGAEDRDGQGLRAWDGLPGIPASAGALLWDRDGRLLLLKPTYKSGWTIPGGVMEADGETPWQACAREVREETGIVVTRGRLVVVDTRPAKRRKAMGLRFLFDCGVLDPLDASRVTVQPEEICAHAFVAPPEALRLLRPAVSRRVAAALAAPPEAGALYLEDGMPTAPIGTPVDTPVSAPAPAAAAAPPDRR